MKREAASTELEQLNAFVGIWETEGEIIAEAEQQVKFKATDTYEWLPGGYFLFHRFEAKIPDGDVIRIEIIGYSQQNHCYTLHSFDSRGNAIVMEGQFEMDNWTFVGQSVLFTGSFTDSGKVFAGSWERREGIGRDWQPWMVVTLHKVD